MDKKQILFFGLVALGAFFLLRKKPFTEVKRTGSREEGESIKALTSQKTVFNPVKYLPAPSEAAQPDFKTQKG